LPWEAVAGLPFDKNASRIRTVLHEVEQKATAEATAGGDVEATVNRADRQRLLGAVDRLEVIGGRPAAPSQDSSLGAARGLPPLALPIPGGIIAGAALGTVIPAVEDGRKMIMRRRTSDWVSVNKRLSAFRNKGLTPLWRLSVPPTTP